MALDSNIVGAVSGTGAEVNTQRQLKVIPEVNAYENAMFVGSVRAMGEVDAGALTGVTLLRPFEVDNDYRTRVSQDFVLDEEVFNFTAQNTGKHALTATTMASTFTAGQWTTNSGNITTASTGVQLSTYASFPAIGTSTLSLDAELAFSQQPTTNTFLEWGLGIPGAATAAPTDGVFFRLNAAGLQGVASFNGTETSTGVFPLADGAGVWAYVNNKRYQFICYLATSEAVFWVNDGSGAVMLGRVPLPAAQPRMMMSSSGQAFFKHRIVGGPASGAFSALLGAYNVRSGGLSVSVLPSVQGSRLYGSYQGFSGGTMGSLANYANSTNPTAAVPTNTSAALGVGLGGQFWETDTLAVTTDGIICSYQVPLATPNVAGRRLVLRNVRVDSFIQTALTGGGYVAQWCLAFGHTAVSLATAESATTKAPRRIGVGVQAVAAGAVAGAVLNSVYIDLGDAPIFVNPGEFVQLVKKKVGTAPSAGVIAHLVTFAYGWE